MRSLIRDVNDVKDVIKNLRKAINSGEIHCSLGGINDIEKIKLFELAFGIHLPASFKVFLTEINGGFIANEEANWHWMQSDYDTAKSISIRLLSVEEIIEDYERLSLDSWKLIPDLEGIYPYIPFCITADNEKLVFVDNQMPGESGVFFALHDEPAKDWTLIAHDFTEFLIYYINSNGQIPTKDLDPTKRAEGFLWTQNLEWRKERFEDPEEVIKRNTAYLELYPKDSITITSRANAFTTLKQYKKALDDYNQSIKWDPAYALTYYCRGQMFLKIKKARQSLIDFDSACKLKPDDPFYLSGRAEAFYELNKMDQALEDCNRAIEIDGNYEIAYMIRYNIYLYLGEAEKAEADAEKLNEFLDEGE